MVEPVPLQFDAAPRGDSLSELAIRAQQIKEFNPYIQTPREDAYFQWLNDRRAVKQSGVVHTSDELALSRSSQVYRAHYSKQKGKLCRIPMPVLYIEVFDPGRSRNLFVSLLEGLGHPFHFGPLADLRQRTWATLKEFGVEMVIVDHADCLSFEALRELLYIKTCCRVSVFLLGNYQLKDTLSRRKYTEIYNHFLNFHIFKPLSKPELQAVILAWEAMSCKFAPGLGIVSPEVLSFLYERTGGVLQPLYDLLNTIAIDRLRNSVKTPLSVEQLNQFCSTTYPARVLKG